ncbi:hypothetical protein VPHK404_0018 [Vibrio phage K404]
MSVISFVCVVRLTPYTARADHGYDFGCSVVVGWWCL